MKERVHKSQNLNPTLYPPLERGWFLLVVATLCFGAALYCRNIYNVWASTTLSALIVLFCIWKLFPSLFKASFRFKEVGIGISVGLILALCTWLLYPWFVEIYPAFKTEVFFLYENVREPPGPLWSIPLLLVIVYAEEIIWRKLAVRKLRRHFSKVSTIFLASFLYALPQLVSGSWVLMMLAVFLGILWSTEAIYTKGVTASFCTHLTWNLLIMVFFPLE